MTGKRALTFPIGKVGIDGTVTTTGTVTLGAGTAAYGKLSANSGVDIGDVDVTSVSPPSSVKYGRITVTTSGTEVQGSSVALTQGVTLRALTANTGLIVVGGDASITTSNGYQLAPGESVFVPCSNLNQVWVDAVTNGEGLSYVGG